MKMALMVSINKLSVGEDSCNKNEPVIVPNETMQRSMPIKIACMFFCVRMFGCMFAERVPSWGV